MRCFVTGGAGFIGSNLVDRLLADKHEVTVYDNFSTGTRYFLRPDNRKNLTIIEGDLLNRLKVTSSMKDHEVVFHLAANADVRNGLLDPARDLHQNTMATFNVLESMRANKIKKIVFSSTGAIYGEPEIVPTSERAPFPIQTSLYGASKLACEGLIEAYCEGYNMQSWIFRFVSIVGERYTHGHVFDFYKQLAAHPDYLNVLGDGTQRKSYLYIQDCITGIFHAFNNSNDYINIFNLGTDDWCTVNDSISWICEYLGIEPKINYGNGNKGWVGDNPFTYLDISEMTILGWMPQTEIRDGIIKTVKYLENNPEILGRV